MYLFLLLGASLLHGLDSLSCRTNMKQGPYILSIPGQTLPNITRLVLKIRRYQLDNEDLNMIIGYRSYWKYCYNGGALDGNTGCYSSLNSLPPNQEELKKWARESQCEVCEEIEGAWGSDSEVCNRDIVPCNKWVQITELEKRESNNHFAYHSCDISWRCGFCKSQAPAHLRMIDYKPELRVALPNGSLVWIGEYFVLNGDTSVLLQDVPRVVSTNIEAKCVEEEHNHWCVDPETKVGFRIKTNEKSTCLGATCYVINKISQPKKNMNDLTIKKG